MGVYTQVGVGDIYSGRCGGIYTQVGVGDYTQIGVGGYILR